MDLRVFIGICLGIGIAVAINTLQLNSKYASLEEKLQRYEKQNSQLAQTIALLDVSLSVTEQALTLARSSTNDTASYYKFISMADGGVMSASAEPNTSMTFCESNIQFFDPIGLDKGCTLFPALQTLGSVYIEGNTVIDGSVWVKLEGNTYANLNEWFKVQQASGGAACIVPCVHGNRNTQTCACVCLEGWTGADCNTGVCENGGQWSVSGETCICEEPWDPVMHCMAVDCGENGNPSYNGTFCVCDPGWRGTKCDLPVSDIVVTTFGPDTDVCLEIDEGGTCFGDCLLNEEEGKNECTCYDAQFGQNCEFECANPNVNSDRCPWRTNWGYDMPCTYIYEIDTTVCVCGGGYTLDPNVIIMSELRCTGANSSDCQSLFDSSAHICCSPSGQCSGSYSQCGVTDNECCYELSPWGRSSCITAGCGWCEQGQVCVSANVVPADCEPPVVQSSGSSTGVWHQYTYDCNIERVQDSAMCKSEVAFQQYNEIYSGCYLYVMSESQRSNCLKDARQAVFSELWPWLSWHTPEVSVGLAHQFVASRGGTNYILSIDYSKAWDTSVALVWREEHAFGKTTDSAFFFEAATHVSYTAYYIVSYTRNNFYCLMMERMDLLARYIAFGPYYNSWPYGNTDDEVYAYMTLIQEGVSDLVVRNVNSCTAFRVYYDTVFEGVHGYGLGIDSIDEFGSILEIRTFV